MVLNIVLFQKGNIYLYSLSMLTYMFFQFFFIFFLFQNPIIYNWRKSEQLYRVRTLFQHEENANVKICYFVKQKFFFYHLDFSDGETTKTVGKKYIFFSCVKHFPFISILQVMHLVFRKSTYNFICR